MTILHVVVPADADRRASANPSDPFRRPRGEDPGMPGAPRDLDSRYLDRFAPLLAMTVLAVAGMSLIDLRAPGGHDGRRIVATAAGLVIGVTLLLALRVAGVPRRWRLLADVFFAASAIVSSVTLAIALTTTSDLSVFDSERVSPVWVLFAIVTPVAVIRRLLQHRGVTTETLLGAIAGYLLIALAFCYADLFLDDVQPGPYFAGIVDAPTTSFMYFSLSSITTVGYGDLAALTPLSRLLATTEAVIGQVYLVTFVAMLVGLMIQSRSRERG
jgi:tellurite resistance protein TehA-like permease